MPEQTLIDHMLTELARRQEDYSRLARETEQAQSAELAAQERRNAAMKASAQALTEVKKMQAALSALGYVPGSPEKDKSEGPDERTTP